MFTRESHDNVCKRVTIYGGQAKGIAFPFQQGEFPVVKIICITRRLFNLGRPRKDI